MNCERSNECYFHSSFLLEFIGGGGLRSLIIDTTNPLNLSEMVKFMVEIANGMAHLHKHNIIHRFVVWWACLKSIC
jgi:serine/threonine protein kinase